MKMEKVFDQRAHLTARHGACIHPQASRRHPCRQSRRLQVRQAPRRAVTAVPGRLRLRAVAPLHTLGIVPRAGWDLKILFPPSPKGGFDVHST